MPDRDTSLTILSSGIALAGLLLVFSGFLSSKAASFDTRRGDKFKILAKFTVAPILIALALSWVSVMALEGNKWASLHLITFLKITLGATAAFAIVGVLARSP